MIVLCLAAALAAEPADSSVPEIGPAVEGSLAPEPEPVWAPRWPGQAAPGSKHYDLEELYAAQKYREGLDLAKARLAQHPDDVDLHWMVARFLFEVGELFDESVSNATREAHYAEMVAVAERGLALKPGDPHLRFAHGIGNGRLGTTRGVLSSLWMASSVEQDWLAAANSGFRYASIDGNEIMPCDVYQALGIYYRLVPDAWIVKVIAGTRGSLEKSLSYNEKSVTCAPDGRVAARKELGVSQLCLGDRNDDAAMLAKGRATLEEVLAMHVESKKDQIDQRHARMLLADPSLACGYSRDGQEDTDTSKLEQ